MAKRIDFTREFDDSNESPKLNTRDLEAGNIEVPPEFAPEAVAAPITQMPSVPTGDAVSPVVSTHQNKGVSKAFLMLVLLLAVGGGAYWKFKLSPTNSESINTETTSVPVAKQPDEATIARLKELWKLGAAAKKRGDFAKARSAWEEGLKIQPDNAGFRESIDKLSRERR